MKLACQPASKQMQNGMLKEWGFFDCVFPILKTTYLPPLYDEKGQMKIN